MSGPIVRIALRGEGASFADELVVAAADPAIRVVVVDIDEGFGRATGHVPAGLEPSARLAALCTAMFDCPKPIVACATGELGGWALTAAASADLLVVTRSTVFGSAPGEDPGASAGPLAYLLPPRMAKWIALGAGTLTSEEAWEAGFVTRVADDDELDVAVAAIADRIALVPADVLSAKKAAHVYDMEVEGFRAVLAGTAEFGALASRL